MGSAENLLEALLTIGGRRDFVVKSYSDGFELQDLSDGGSGWFRRLPLDPGVGWLGFSEENDVTELRVSGVPDGLVARPSQSVSELAGGDAAFRMRWPTACTSAKQEAGSVIRYEVSWSDAAPDRWFALRADQLWLGLSADDAIVSLIVEARRSETTRVPVALIAGGFAVTLQAGRLLSVQFQGGSGQEALGGSASAPASLESARGNAWLARAANGALEALEVEDVEEGEPVHFDAAASQVSEARFWQQWPADVRATRWRVGDRTAVGVAFGGDRSERWLRLSGDDVWVGSSAGGELRHLVFGDVELPPEGFDDRNFLPFEFDPTDPTPYARVIEPGSVRFSIYGLAGQLGSPGGSGATRGIPSSLTITFADPERGSCRLSVTSSRETDSWLARMNVASDLIQDETGPDESESLEEMQAYYEEWHLRHRAIEEEILAEDWSVVSIPVAGESVDFSFIRRGDRWAAVSRVARTTISIVAEGYQPQDIALDTIDDLAPYVEHERARLREDVQRRMTPEAFERLAARGSVSPEQRALRAAIRTPISGLMNAMHRLVGAPEMASLFTGRVVETWGGRERYQRLLWLHTMLRPITGHGGSSEYPKMQDDGSALMRISVQHATPARGQNASGIMVLRSSTEEEPEPSIDRSAIRAGEEHYITLRVVPEGETWLLDTDFLEILIDRVGTIAEIARPWSEQTG
jgi:hypothetical protein